jgi:8-oxo-dGTP pyrophosphatase MutT (NUDIX family)
MARSAFDKGCRLRVYHTIEVHMRYYTSYSAMEEARPTMSTTDSEQAPHTAATITRDFAATTFVVHEQRTLLLRHRKLGMWLPPGGHIDPHELPDQAALREVREETGLDVDLLAQGSMLGHVQVLPQPHCLLLETIGPGHQHIDLIYFARVCGGSLAHAEREALAARWFTWDELADPEIAEDIRALGQRAIESYR